jgi:hypothetical protein
VPVFTFLASLVALGPGASFTSPVSLVLLGGVEVWLAGPARLSCLNLHQWIAMGMGIDSVMVSLVALYLLKPAVVWP